MFLLLSPQLIHPESPSDGAGTQTNAGTAPQSLVHLLPTSGPLLPFALLQLFAYLNTGCLLSSVHVLLGEQRLHLL